MIRKFLVLLLALAASAAMLAHGSPADAATPSSGPLTCTGTSQYYGYAVAGTLTMPNAPGGVTVTTTHHVAAVHYTYTYVAISNTTPVLDNSYAGGSYLAAGLNAWRLGTGSYDNASYWLLLPTSTLGVISQGRIVAVTNQPVDLACKAPSATGNTGAFRCSAKLKTSTYAVTGVIAAPENPTSTTVTRDGVPQGSAAAPGLDNTFFGGYWLSSYGWNSWALTGTASGGIWLVIPNTPLSGTFTGELVIVYPQAGNNQLPATCAFV